MIFCADGTIKYTVIRSKRAKHVRLKVSRNSGLQVVVPLSFKEKLLPQIVEKRADWIRNVAEKLEIPEDVSSLPPMIPDEIDLLAIGEKYSVRYMSEEELSEKRVDADKIIRTLNNHLSVEMENCIYLPEGLTEEGCVDLLQSWLIRSGKECLPDLLDKASEAHGIPYKKLQVRMQKGRWGSCSGRGTISLNARLLLLPAELLEYILLHELAHVHHPNHSQAYWSYLQSLDRQALGHDAAMVDAWRYIPRCFSM